MPLTGGLRSFLRIWPKGREPAHLVYAGDVASAAVSFVDRPGPPGDCRYFIVSSDDDPDNTVGGVWAIARTMLGARAFTACPYPSVAVSALLRRRLGRRADRGHVRYSPHQLREAGLRPPWASMRASGASWRPRVDAPQAVRN